MQLLLEFGIAFAIKVPIEKNRKYQGQKDKNNKNLKTTLFSNYNKFHSNFLLFFFFFNILEFTIFYLFWFTNL